MKMRAWLGIGLLALAAGSIAGTLAWNHSHPLYTSEGIVRIAYTLPTVLQIGDQNAPLPLFDEFMQSQKTLIGSRRVIDQAMREDVWKAYHMQAPADPGKYFAEHLKVVIAPNSELILIRVNDESPTMAAAAVTAVINAYQDLYNEEEQRMNRMRLGLLEDQVTSLEKRHNETQQEEQHITEPYGTTKLEPYYNVLFDQVTKLESQVREGKTAQALPGAATDGSLSAAQIAMVDPTLRTYVDQRDERQNDYRKLQAQLPADSAQLGQARESLSAAEAKVSDYVKAYAARLEAQTKELADARAELLKLGNQMRRLDEINHEMASIDDDASLVKKRIEVLRAEGELGGRFSVVSTGEIPLSPQLDTRLRDASIAGGTAFSVPILLGGMLVILRRRGTPMGAAV